MARGPYYKETLESPALKAAAVTPDDNNDLSPVPARALFVGGAGNLSVIFADDSVAVTITGVLAGTVYPFRVKRVRLTGTTATNIVALY